jgi:hypothetical protein
LQVAYAAATTSVLGSIVALAEVVGATSCAGFRFGVGLSSSPWAKMAARMTNAVAPRKHSLHRHHPFVASAPATPAKAGTQ